MKKLFTIFILILLISFTGFAQVKIGLPSGAPQSSSVLDLTNTGDGTKALALPQVANTAAIATPINGMLIYDLSSTTIKSYQNNAWSVLGSGGSSSSSTVIVDCAGSATNGTYAQNVALTAANTVTISIVNNSFSAATFSTATTDITLTGTAAAGMTVASVSPASVSPTPGGGKQTITYTLTGTPSTLGTFTATFNKATLTCAKTAGVCVAMSAITVSNTTNPSPLPIPTVSGNTIAFSAAGGLPNTSGFTWVMTSYPAGLFTNAASGTGNSATAILVANAAGTITTTFTASNACANFTGSQTVGVGDGIRASLSTNVLAYDGAISNAWVQITATEYANLLMYVANSAKYGAIDAEMFTSTNAPTGYTVTESQNQSKLPAANYPIAMSITCSNTASNWSGFKLKLSPGATAQTGYADVPSGSSLPSVNVGAGVQTYYVIKKPTTITASSSFIGCYQGASGTIGFKSTAGTQVYYQSGDVNTLTGPAAFGNMNLQLIGTPNKQW